MRDVFELVGTTVRHHYRVDELVGEGGFGVVYKAHHLFFDRPVALKMLKVPPHFTAEARATFEERFREEARVLAKLADHPAVVQVMDFGTAPVRWGEEVPYLVLEWLVGSDLEGQMLAHRAAGAARHSPQEALDLLWPAIDALALAHRLGVAHRDIKPANLFLCDTALGRTTKVLDFGIAKAMQAGDTASRAFTSVNGAFRAFTPTHGAPEQILPTRFGASGPWTDVYSLGMILSELLAGRAAIPPAPLAMMLNAAISAERPTPRALGAQVDDALEAVLARALALDPRERFPNAESLKAALAPFGRAASTAAALSSTLPERGAGTLVLDGLDAGEPAEGAGGYMATVALDPSELDVSLPSEEAQVALLEQALDQAAPRGFWFERRDARRWRLTDAERASSHYEIRLADGIVTVVHGNMDPGPISIERALKRATCIELAGLDALGFSLEEALVRVLRAFGPNNYG